jgi:hypothetical protein
VSRWAPAPAPIEPEPPPPTPTQEEGRISRWLDSQRPPPPRRRVRPSGWDVPPQAAVQEEACRHRPGSPSAGDDPTTAEDEDSDSEDERDYFDIIDPETQIPAEHQATVDSMLAKMQTLFPSKTQGENLDRARRAVESSFKRANEEFTIDTAVKAAGDFHFDQTALDRDMRDLEQSGYDLEKMFAARRRQNSGSKLSARRVREALSPDNPQRELLREMAQGGVRVSDVVPEDLQTTGTDPVNWPRLRPTYKKAASAVYTLLSEGFHKPGLAVILPETVLKRLQKQDRCNVFTSSWAFNTGKELGRPTGDPSNLNCDSTKAAASQLWGKVRHPTIRSIVEQINAFATHCEEKGRSLAECSLWKIDVKGAYTLQDYAIPDCALFMTQLLGGYVLIYTCGCFGFAGQPMAFDVITRALRWELRTILKGVGEGYVDDFFGITLTDNLLHDMSAITSKVRALLDQNAINEAKSKHGRRMEIIGWDIDLDKKLVTIGERCLERALYGFIIADEFSPMPLKQLQRLGSWARRYGQVNKLLLPFTTALNHATRGKTNPHYR